MNRQPYPTDASNTKWKYLEPHLPEPRASGPPRVHPVREILNAFSIITRRRCAWRLLPDHLLPWKTVYHYLRLWHL
jgi:putative transposase